MAAAKSAKQTKATTTAKNKKVTKKVTKKATVAATPKKAVSKSKTSKPSKASKFIADVIKQAISTLRVATKETMAITKALNILEKQGAQLNKKLASAKSPKPIETKIAKNYKLVLAAKATLQESQASQNNIASLLETAKNIGSAPAKSKPVKKAANKTTEMAIAG